MPKSKFRLNDQVVVLRKGHSTRIPKYVICIEYDRARRANLYTLYTRPPGKGGAYAGTYTASDLALAPTSKRPVPKKQTNPAPPTKTHTVSESFIKEAHEAACLDWKKKLEKQFPDVLVPKVRKTMFDFGAYEFRMQATTAGCSADPIRYIANGVAPEGEAGLWLVMQKDWNPVIKKHDGYTLLGFERKAG